jgi:uncharacterized protein
MGVLGVFAKQPVPGAVKTRLARETTPEWACEVAAAFLADTLDRVAVLPVERILVYAPAQAQAWFESAGQGRFALQPQADGDLGQRMQAFFETHIGRGADCTVIVGTDSPTLPVDYIKEAFDLCADVVLGPARDGGYYLLGCGPRGAPPIFDGIAWGTAGVLAETVRRLDGWHLNLLPPWYDVDTLADWQALCGHIAAMRAAGIEPMVPRTEALAEQGRSAIGGR